MQKFTTLTSIAAPLLQANVDTDTIIRPKRRWPLPNDEELAQWAFGAIRYLPDGNANPDFILNQPPYDEAKILLCGRNFGCGSSRENAVTSLAAFGLRCFIAPSYGGIFLNNCFQNGLLPIELPEDTISTLATQVSENPAGTPLTINLETCTISAPDIPAIPFSIDPLRRTALLEGLDDVTATLQMNPQIDAFRHKDATHRPWLYPGTTEQ
jgi:3-isopropylmalate/(R)-2-methylmalate dehydratase small subunit